MTRTMPYSCLYFDHSHLIGHTVIEHYPAEGGVALHRQEYTLADCVHSRSPENVAKMGGNNSLAPKR